ncbi:hypothetical protein AVEN_147858-2-1, partial [Araneus ventricosus]
WGRGGLVEPCFRSRWTPGSKPDPTEDPPCLWASCTFNLTWVKHPIADVVGEFGEGVPAQVSFSSSVCDSKLRSS